MYNFLPLGIYLWFKRMPHTYRISLTQSQGFAQGLGSLKSTRPSLKYKNDRKIRMPRGSHRQWFCLERPESVWSPRNARTQDPPNRSPAAPSPYRCMQPCRIFLYNVSRNMKTCEW